MGHTITVRSKEWEYSLLNMSGFTSEEERQALVKTSITTYLDRKKEGRFKGERYEGAVEKVKGYAMIAPGFSGVEFKATIENERGTSKLAVLVCESIPFGLN